MFALSALWFIFVSLVNTSSSFGANVPKACHLACQTLSGQLTAISYLGAEAHVELWSKFQNETVPECRVEPQDAQDISTILSILRHHGCHFAVLGGGTSPFKGASNAEGGVTIDMRRLNEISFADDKPLLVNVGAGCVWADVYAGLDRWNMSATGTRNSLTGVVGSILGGGVFNPCGISFFSQQQGWACDTVVEFEVVLANSSVVKASETDNSHLFWALKGGGNNLGIVTKVVIEAFRNPPTWYTFQRFDHQDLFHVFERLEKHTIAMPENIWQIATTYQWHVETDSYVISERMVRSVLPEFPESVPRTHSNGSTIDFPVLQTLHYQRSILEMAQKMDGMNEAGYYNYFGSVTVRSKAEVSLALAQIFQKETEAIKGAEGLHVFIVYNPLTLETLMHMQKRGGNALGLVPEDGPLTIVNINLHWSDPTDTPRMTGFIRTLIKRLRETASEMKMLHPYVFQNHAFEEQNVFTGSNVGRLRETCKQVDPDGVFQLLQPGGFKLEGSPVAEKETLKDEL